MIENEEEHELVDVKIPETERQYSIPDDGELDLEDKELPVLVREAGIDAALNHWREVLADIDDYAVFASTAMYLYGKERDVPNFDVPPGDLDVVVMSEATLQKVHERLNNVPGIEWDNEGKTKRFSGEDGKVLSGTLRFALTVDGKTRIMRQPFEFYYKSRIADDEALKHRTTLRGIHVLSLEGLQHQYGNNLRLEAAKMRNVDHIIHDVLTNPDVGPTLQAELKKWAAHDENKQDEPFVPSIVLADTLQNLDLTREGLATAFFVLNQRGSFTAEEFEEKISRVLSGQKTKTTKRQKNLAELEDAQRLSL